MADRTLSTYYHATLYAFNGNAGRAVASRFIGAMHGDASIACHYDKSLEMFCLKCPTPDGANCDAQLTQIIRDYVDRELQAAADEQREPDIMRFPQSRLDALDSFADEEMGSKPGNASTQNAANPVTHIIITLEGQSSLVRLFPLHELSHHGLLERYIAPKTTRSQKAFEGLVVRAAVWSIDGYVFNGRVDRTRATASGDQELDLNLPSFLPLRDQRPGVRYEPVEAAPFRQWEFIKGQENTPVHQWLHGTAQTRQTDPDTKSDMPKDSKEMFAAESTHTMGRARVPKGINLLSSDEEDSDDEVSSSGSEDATFAALVGATSAAMHQPALPSTYSSSDSEAASTFQNLLPGNENERVSEISKESAQTRQESSSTAQQWATNDRKYAKVDHIGLTANASSTVQWEAENSPHLWSRKAKAKGTRVVPRPSAAGSANTPAPSAPATSGLADDGLLIETLERLPEDWALRKTTMRQRAGKIPAKGRGKRQAQTKDAFKAQLELPDPVPAARQRRKQQEPAEESTVRRQEHYRTETNGPRLKASTKITKDNHAFGKLLDLETKKQQNLDDDDVEVPSTKLCCNFGLCLVRPDESAIELRQGAADPIELQTKLREHAYQIRTNFLQRVTASEEDAKYILRSVGTEFGAGGELESGQSSAWYELIVRDSAEVQLKVTVDEAGLNARIQRQDQILGEAVCHLPVHVFDIRFRLQRPGVAYDSPSTQAIKDFVHSMSTDQVAPSFRGMIPDSRGTFSIKHVQAKRSCNRRFHGCSFVLTEVEELLLEPLALEHYNFKALSLAREEMISEQRYWWEVSWETNDLNKADELQKVAVQTIGYFDGVGLESRGPWVRDDGYRSDDNNSEVLDPLFW